MNYRISAKKRRTKRILERLAYILTFGGRKFSGGEKVLFIGLIIATVGVWQNWLKFSSTDMLGNGFHHLLGGTGYILLLNTLVILFLLLGGKTKEQLKNHFHIYAKDTILILCLLGANFLFVLNGFFIINNAIMLQVNIGHEPGIIVTLVGYLLAIFGGIGEIYFSRSEKMYIDESLKDHAEYSPQSQHNHNMKLPF